MAGILTPPPKLARKLADPNLSAQQRARIEKRVQFTSRPPAGGGGSGGGQSFDGLSAGQNKVINQRNRADASLGRTANQTILPRVNEAYANEFDWSQLPTGPVQGDFNNWRQSQIDATYEDFNRRFEPQFSKQAESFEQDMYNRGIPVGSELYNQQKQLMQQGQQDARSSALVQAQGLAGQNAQQFFDIGTQARGNALNEGMLQRNMPLSEFNALSSAQSPMMMANLGYAQQRGLNQQQGDIARSMPRGGGGDPYGGFGSTEALWAAQDARQRANQAWQWANQPKAPSGPSVGAQIGGQVLGTGFGILGNYASQNWF